MFDVDPILLKNYRASVDLSDFPRGFQKQFQQWDEETRDRWYFDRFKCLKYHLYLSGFVVAEKPGDPHLPIEYVPILRHGLSDGPAQSVICAVYPEASGRKSGAV